MPGNSIRVLKKLLKLKRDLIMRNVSEVLVAKAKVSITVTIFEEKDGSFITPVERTEQQVLLALEALFPEKLYDSKFLSRTNIAKEHTVTLNIQTFFTLSEEKPVSPKVGSSALGL